MSKDQLDQQLTAKALIGKNVYDNQGQRIGDVQDVVLDASRAPQLAGAFSNRQAGTTRSGTGATSGSTTRQSGDTSASASTGDSSSGAGTSARTSGATGSTGAVGTMSDTVSGALSGAYSAMTGAGAAAIISTGGFMGMGDNLVRVPLSQLNYDASNERITLSISRDELSNMTKTDATRGTAE